MEIGENLLYIDNIDTFKEWGVSIERGSLSEFLRYGERKIAYSHEWLDQPGTQYDPEEKFIPKSIDYTLNFNFTSGELWKYAKFMKYITENRLLDFYIPSMDQHFIIMYINSSSSTIVSIKDEFLCKFTVLFRNNFEVKDESYCQ